jgi:hypothetical protein
VGDDLLDRGKDSAARQRRCGSGFGERPGLTTAERERTKFAGSPPTPDSASDHDGGAFDSSNGQSPDRTLNRSGGPKAVTAPVGLRTDNRVRPQAVRQTQLPLPSSSQAQVPRSSRARNTLAVLFLILVGAALRIVFLRYPLLDSDQAVVGLIPASLFGRAGSASPDFYSGAFPSGSTICRPVSLPWRRSKRLRNALRSKNPFRSCSTPLSRRSSESRTSNTTMNRSSLASSPFCGGRS